MSLPPHLHLLTIPTPFQVGPVNVYLAEGDPLTLIDTGPKSEAAREALQAALREHGYGVGDIRRIILTHHHADHVGLAGEIAAQTGAEIWTHPYNFTYLHDYAAARAQFRPFFKAIWRESGVPAEIVESMDASGGGFTQWQDPLPKLSPLSEGETVTLGGEAWQVYHTPGHAGGLICLWEPTRRVLLANDHILLRISSNPVLEPPPGLVGPRPKRLVEYLFHLQRMAALNIALALPGHGDLVHDVDGLVKQRLKFHYRRADRIADMLNDSPHTLWELTQTSFPKLKPGLDYFLGLSEVLGHLDILEEAGTIAQQPDQALVRWNRVTPANV